MGEQEQSESKKKVRVLVQGHFLHHPYSGIGVFLEELLREWSKDPTLDIHVLCWFETHEQRSRIEGYIKDHVEGHPITFIWTKLHPKLPRSLSLRLWEMCTIPKILRSQDTFHHYFSPDIQPKTLPFSKKTKSVHMVLHDTFLFTEPLYTAGLTRRLYNIFLRKMLRDTSIELWTVSQESRRSILANLAPDREIHLLANGVDHLQRIPPRPWPEVAKSFNLSEKHPLYILYNGGYDARKNVPALLEVFQKLHAQRPELRLVLCGNSHFVSKLYDDTSLLSGLEGVIHTGFIERDTLRSLLQHASIVASPSRAEGFNIVIGEALLEHAQVIASEIPVHREVWGKYALLTDYADLTKTTALFEKVLSEESKKLTLSAKEQEKFSWKYQAGKIRRFFV